MSKGLNVIPRNVRNNNPLNIKVTSDNWKGAVGDDGVFVEFSSPVWGFRAAHKILSRYIDAYGLTRIEDIVRRWAPAEDNNHTDEYIQYLIQKMPYIEGVSTMTPSSLIDILFPLH